MLHVLNQQYPSAVAGLLTTTNEAFDRVAMHAVRRELLEAQAAAAGLPLHVVPLPWPCSNEEYEATCGRRSPASSPTASPTWRSAICFSRTCAAIARSGSPAPASSRCSRSGRPSRPRDLAHDMIDGGLQARLTCIDPRKLDRSFAGRAFDQQLLDDLPAGVDPCGENGEFHSFACRGPDVQPPDRR